MKKFVSISLVLVSAAFADEGIVVKVVPHSTKAGSVRTAPQSRPVANLVPKPDRISHPAIPDSYVPLRVENGRYEIQVGVDWIPARNPQVAPISGSFVNRNGDRVSYVQGDYLLETSRGVVVAKAPGSLDLVFNPEGYPLSQDAKIIMQATNEGRFAMKEKRPMLTADIELCAQAAMDASQLAAGQAVPILPGQNRNSMIVNRIQDALPELQPYGSFDESIVTKKLNEIGVGTAKMADGRIVVVQITRYTKKK